MYLVRCGSSFTRLWYRASPICSILSKQYDQLGLPWSGLSLQSARQHQVDRRQQSRSMTITTYKKRKRTLFSGGIPRDQFDNEEKSREFAMELLPNEQELLLSELHKLQTKRQQNGEPSSLGRNISSLDGTSSAKPTQAQLNLVSLSHAIPFIGFGFLDNAIMIVAGDYIDLRIGAVLGISTMAAAGFGNLISDLAGLGLAGYVEALAIKLGVPMPQLTPDQLDMASTRWAAYTGRSLGIIVGCILGMFPLLFLETRHSEDKLEPAEGS